MSYLKKAISGSERRTFAKLEWVSIWETMLSVTEGGDEEANWELSEGGWDFFFFFDKADGRQRTKTSVISTSRDCLSSLEESGAV